MKKTLIRIMSVIMAMMIAVSCASAAFAEEESYTYVCQKCGETVSVTNGVDFHNMFCEGNGMYCESCGEIIYGGTIEYTVHRSTCAIIQRLSKISTEIKNNPGETTLNYGDTLKLSAVLIDDGDTVDIYAEGLSFKWSTDSSAVRITSYGDTCEVEAVKAGKATITLNIVDADGNIMEAEFEDKDGNICTPYSDSQTIIVKAGFFEKLISFFKDLFGMDRTIVQ